jgi:hypothetical protein
MLLAEGLVAAIAALLLAAGGLHLLVRTYRAFERDQPESHDAPPPGGRAGSVPGSSPTTHSAPGRRQGCR